MKLTPIISKLLNLKEENISGVINNLIKDHVSEINLKNNLRDPLSPLFKRAAEISKTDLKCLTAKRA